MKFLGKELSGALPSGMDWSKNAIVVVSAELPNTCGHVLLYVGGATGHYFHYTGPSVHDYPLYMKASEYPGYLSSHNKTEIIRKSNLSVPHHDLASKRLHELMHKKWLTFVVSHNCATFVSEVLHAGGNFHTMPKHCPAMDLASIAFWERIFGPIRQKLGTQDAYEHLRLR